MRFSGLLVQFLFVTFVAYEGQNHTADNTENPCSKHHRYNPLLRLCRPSPDTS